VVIWALQTLSQRNRKECIGGDVTGFAPRHDQAFEQSLALLKI
jgi:hypothetical protein